MTKAWGVECPECGDMVTRAYDSGHDEENHRIRARKCEHCGHRFSTVEVVVPGFDYYRATAYKRGRRALYPRRRSLDRVVVKPHTTGLTIGVVRGEWMNVCRKGLHELTPDNVYMRTDGQRTCQACRRASALALYHHKMRNMPPALLAEWREKENKRKREGARRRKAA